MDIADEIDFLYPSKNKNEGVEHTVVGNRPLRMSILVIILVSSFLFLTARLFNLQIVEGEKNRALSRENKIRRAPVYFERGIIYGKEGSVLAKNRASFRLFLDLALGKPTDEEISLVSSVVSVDKKRVKNLFNEKSEESEQSYISLSTVTRDDALKLEPLIAEGKASHFFIEPLPIRDYPMGSAFAHILGYLGEVNKKEVDETYDLGDRVGRLGVEEASEGYLRGVKGQRIYEVDSLGRRLGLVFEQASLPGKNVHLSINEGLQRKSYEVLKQAVLKKNASGGAIVAQDPSNGRVLAMVSYPSFDPNAFSEDADPANVVKILEDPGKPIFNRAISGAFPPGSTFKIVTGSAALEEHVITPDFRLKDEGGIAYGSFYYADWQAGGHGMVDMRRAYQVSCDTYFYTVGGGYGSVSGVGVKKLGDWAKLFGFGEKLGSGLVGEESGLVPDSSWKEKEIGEPWYIGNTYHFAIGQGYLLVTTLQLNSMLSVIANGGTLWQPQVAEKVVDQRGKLVKDFFPKKIRDSFVSRETIEVVREGLRLAVLPGGTGYPMQELKAKTAGKTGTSEIGKNGKTHAWFTVYAPYSENFNDMPKIVLTIFLEEGGEGSDDAAPVARDILKYFFGE